MENIYKNNVLKSFIVFLLSFTLLFTSFNNSKNVYANNLDLLTKGGATAIIGIVLTSLAARGAISGNFSLTQGEITTIKHKAQENLEKLGTAAVEQANKLGDAIAAGAESAKIKALATGAVIYAFAQAIQDTIFNRDYEQEVSQYPGEIFLASFGDVLVTTKYGVSGFTPPFSGYNHKLTVGDTYDYDMYFTDGQALASGNWGNWNQYSLRIYARRGAKLIADNYVNSDKQKLPCGYHVVAYKTGPSIYTTAALGIEDSLRRLDEGAVFDPKLNEIASAPSLTIPTELPTNIVDNINNWDGTSDLVLAPPLPWEIPEGQDLVIDPSYVGEGTIDPPKPTTDPDPPAEEEGITLPWLAALLGLLGFGNPSLEGIDAGIKSAIDKLIDQITTSAQDVYDWADSAEQTITKGLEGIRAKVGEIAGALTGSLVAGIEGIQSIAGSIAEALSHAFDPPSKDIDWDKLKNIQLFNKFPFSIPSDLYFLFGLVAANPVAPCVKIPFDMTFLGGENIDATIDLAQFDNVAVIIRTFEFIAFIVGMLYLTKSLIWK